MGRWPNGKAVDSKKMEAEPAVVIEDSNRLGVQIPPCPLTLK